MQAHLPPSLVIAAAPLPQASPSTPSARATVPNGEASFSRQLEQTRQTRAQQNARPAAPEPAPKAPAPPPPAANASARNTQSDSAYRNEATRASARAAAARKGDAPPAKAESSAAEAQSDAADTDPSQTAAASASELLALLGPAPEPAAVPVEPARAAATGTTLPLADPAAAAAAAADGAAGAPATATAARPAAVPQALPNDAAVHAAAPAATLASAGPEAALAVPAQTAARDPRGASGNDNTAIAAEPASWQQAQAAALAENNPFAREGLDTRRSERATPLDSTDRGLAALGPTAAANPTTNTPKAAEVAQASLATPATSAEFRAALGAQVSIFARAGVQQAELHLNPAELGPVSIQIVLDGQQAQVNFGADSPLTRQIIEAGMPELAGALRDAGLTLTGGGVSQHGGGQRQDGNGSGSAGGPSSNAQSGTAADGTTDAQVEQIRRSAVRVAQGGVDLYA